MRSASDGACNTGSSRASRQCVALQHAKCSPIQRGHAGRNSPGLSTMRPSHHRSRSMHWISVEMYFLFVRIRKSGMPCETSSVACACLGATTAAEPGAGCEYGQRVVVPHVWARGSVRHSPRWGETAPCPWKLTVFGVGEMRVHCRCCRRRRWCCAHGPVRGPP